MNAREAMSVRWRALTAAILAAAAVVAVLAALQIVRHSRASESAGKLSVSGQPMAHAGVSSDHLQLPSCSASLTKSYPTVISISTKSPRQPTFSRPCYYAAAGRNLAIHFTNATTFLSQSGTNLSLIISPSKHPAIAPVKGTPGEFVGIMSRATFVSTPVKAPDTVTFSVPALHRGTYVLQLTNVPPTFLAVLVVN